MDLIIILIVELFSVSQSPFGIGRLAFGTSTLLLLGYSFSDVLSILQPSSLSICSIQVVHQYKQQTSFALSLMRLFLPVLIVSLAWTLLNKHKINLQHAVTTILIFTTASRFSLQLSAGIRQFIGRHHRLWLMTMEPVHGMTNMGGVCCQPMP